MVHQGQPSSRPRDTLSLHIAARSAIQHPSILTDFFPPKTRREILALRPLLLTELTRQRQTISKLVRITPTSDMGGWKHSAYPSTMLHYHLLTEAQLDSLATFYHQDVKGRYTDGYPKRMKWRADMGIEEKRREWGHFMGFRGCEKAPPRRVWVEEFMRRVMEMVAIHRFPDLAEAPHIPPGGCGEYKRDSESWQDFDKSTRAKAVRSAMRILCSAPAWRREHEAMRMVMRLRAQTRCAKMAEEERRCRERKAKLKAEADAKAKMARERALVENAGEEEIPRRYRDVEMATMRLQAVIDASSEAEGGSTGHEGRAGGDEATSPPEYSLVPPVVKINDDDATSPPPYSVMPPDLKAATGAEEELKCQGTGEGEGIVTGQQKQGKVSRWLDRLFSEIWE